MDNLDLKVFKSLVRDAGSYTSHKNVRKPMRAIAKELGIDEGTVRNRLNKLHEGGFLLGERVFINPAAMGQNDVHLRFEVLPLSLKEDVIRKIRLIEGVYLIRDYFGNVLSADFVCEDLRSAERVKELISRIANADAMVQVIQPPESKVFRFSEADMKIVESIQASPRKPYNKISLETRLSTRKVKHRLKMMIDAGVLLVMHSLNYGVAKGIIKGDLLVFYDGTQSKKQVDGELMRILGDRVLVPHLDLSDSAFFSLLLTNISERKKILGAVKRVKGVNKVYLDLVEEHLELYETFAQQLERKSVQVGVLKETA